MIGPNPGPVRHVPATARPKARRRRTRSITMCAPAWVSCAEADASAMLFRQLVSVEEVETVDLVQTASLSICPAKGGPSTWACSP